MCHVSDCSCRVPRAGTTSSAPPVWWSPTTSSSSSSVSSSTTSPRLPCPSPPSFFSSGPSTSPPWAPWCGLTCCGSTPVPSASRVASCCTGSSWAGASPARRPPPSGPSWATRSSSTRFSAPVNGRVARSHQMFTLSFVSSSLS